MKKNLSYFLLAILLAPVMAVAQTATPTATHTPTATPTFAPFIVGLSGFNLETSTATPQHQLGIPYFGKEGVYLYGKSTVTVTAGQWVVFSAANELTLLDNTAALAASVPLRVCVATAGASTTTPYVWTWCGGGVFNALLSNGVTANSALTTTAVDGTAGTTGVAINSCVNVAAGVTATRVPVRCGSFAQTYAVPPTPAATTTP